MDKNHLINENWRDDRIQTAFKTKFTFSEELLYGIIIGNKLKVKNHFKFISSLLSKGILCDGTKETEIFGLKNMLVQFAMKIVSRNGIDATAGLIEALEESENSHIIAAILSENKFALQAYGDCGKPKGGGSVVQATTSTGLPNGINNAMETEDNVAGGRT